MLLRTIKQKEKEMEKLRIKPVTKTLKPKKASLSQKVTTLHGINHFYVQNRLYSKIWKLLLMVIVVWTIAFSAVIKERYKNNQLVNQIHSDYPLNQVPFPAVSICNFNMVSLKETATIARILMRSNVTEKKIHSFFRNLEKLKSFDVSSRKVGNYSEIMRILKNHYIDMRTIMEDVHQKCENLLVYCEFNRKEKKCADIFRLRLTLEGYCCAFNYAALEDDSRDPFLLTDADLEYYYEESSGSKTEIVTTGRAGRNSGLRIVFNIQPNDYPEWSLVPAYGAKIIISDPNDFPETTILYKHMMIGFTHRLKVSPAVFQSHENLRKVPPMRRGCWFHDEISLQYTDRYSFETCRTECKMHHYKTACGCIPYKYPSARSSRVCEIEDLPCLNNMKVYWSEERYPCDPPCFLECNDKSYTMTDDTLPFLERYFPHKAVEGRNLSELACVHVFYLTPTCNVYSMFGLHDFSFLIATYGGVLPLCFGGSLITVFEILYLLVDALATILCRFWRRRFERRRRVHVS